jgi:hypothetical protein
MLLSMPDIPWGRRLETDMSAVLKTLAAVLVATVVIVVILELLA